MRVFLLCYMKQARDWSTGRSSIFTATGIHGLKDMCLSEEGCPDETNSCAGRILNGLLFECFNAYFFAGVVSAER